MDQFDTYRIAYELTGEEVEQVLDPRVQQRLAALHDAVRDLEEVLPERLRRGLARPAVPRGTSSYGILLLGLFELQAAVDEITSRRTPVAEQPRV